MPRLKLTLAYVGTCYHGWQTQSKRGSTGASLPTIQKTLEEAISHVVGYYVHVHGSGRTDSGVHADGQVAHVDIPEEKQAIDWQCALHTLLPSDIRVVCYEIVDRNFHAQHSVVKKIYAYRLWLSQKYTPPNLYPFVWSCGHVDVQAMDEASKYLIGTHDFSSLQNRGTKQKSAIRTIYSIDRESLESSILTTYEMVWRFEANGFLKQMVRNIMGLLVMVGRGKIEPQNIFNILQEKTRPNYVATAPAHGLTLKQVVYN